MKCVKHNAEAAGVCIHCGRAVCAECIPSPSPARLTCTPECAIALEKSARGLELLLQKSVQSAKASAIYYYLYSALSAGASIAAYFVLPSPFLIWFTGGCAVALFATGFWYTRISRKTNF